MRNGATTLDATLDTTPSTAPGPAASPVVRPAGPPPGPRSAGLVPQGPLLRRAPRVRPVRRVLDLEAASVVELVEPVEPVGRVEPLEPLLDESALSIQDRIRRRADEAAARA